MSYRSVTDDVIAANTGAAVANTGAAVPFPGGVFGGEMFDPMSLMSGAMSMPGGLGLTSTQKSSADSQFDNAFGFDNSGWNVTQGGGAITSDRNQAAPMLGDVLPGAGSGWIMTAGLVIAGLIALKIFMKGRK